MFPNLTSAKMSYKLWHELDGALPIGPILPGRNIGAPVHVLQADYNSYEIVNMAAVVVIDVQGP